MLKFKKNTNVKFEICNEINRDFRFILCGFLHLIVVVRLTKNPCEAFEFNEVVTISNTLDFVVLYKRKRVAVFIGSEKLKNRILENLWL